MNNIIRSRLLDFLENSFLAPILLQASVTDVSYNGEAIFYEDKNLGRKKAGITISIDEVGDFLRQIANFSEKQFSYMSPNLDVSFGRYRLNATFSSIVRVNQRKAYSFAIRIASVGSSVEDNPAFFPEMTKEYLLSAIENKESIAIAGETGSGKTELQKYLLMHMRPNTRVIVIDNIGELELCRGNGDVDLTFWQADDRFPAASYPTLIRNALRNNPDYLILAESRGEEMQVAMQAVMSGHPIITTLHAKDIAAIPFRMGRMAQGYAGKESFEDVLTDIYHHFENLVYVSKRTIDGRIIRQIDAVGRLEEKGQRIKMIYERK